MERANENILYHYTDFQAVDGILRCAQLRVNNVLRMNDSAEMRHFMVRLASAIVLRLKDGGDHAHAQTAAAFFQEELRKEYTAFAACFSFRRDDAAQWERYGNWGRGVCIAFQGKYLQRMAKGVMSLQTVFYQDDMAAHNLTGVFYRLVKRKKDLAEAEHGTEIKKAMNYAWSCAAAYKHPSFLSEREVRLVVSPFVKEYFEIKPCYHTTKERIKKYYPLDLQNMCRKIGIGWEELVPEIIIGPESTQSRSILQDYLRDNGLAGLAERVSLSNCPLRRSPA